MWLNVQTMIRHVLPLRAHLFRYMCSLTDGELRVAGTRNMIELVWAAAKEPMENRCTFDRDSLELSLKYFTCSTLTIRLAGITHINVSLVQSRLNISLLVFMHSFIDLLFSFQAHINMYNEFSQGEVGTDTET